MSHESIIAEAHDAVTDRWPIIIPLMIAMGNQKKQGNNAPLTATSLQSLSFLWTSVDRLAKLGATCPAIRPSCDWLELAATLRRVSPLPCVNCHPQHEFQIHIGRNT